MMLIFFSEINLKLKASEKSSVNLLNGMHEGLLILSQETADNSRQIRYANNSAQKLITNFVGPI